MIKLYSQPSCGMCRTIHMMLDKKGIEYEECQDLQVMKEIGINHTPTLDVDGVLLSGREILDYINTGKLPEGKESTNSDCKACEVR